MDATLQLNTVADLEKALLDLLRPDIADIFIGANELMSVRVNGVLDVLPIIGPPYEVLRSFVNIHSGAPADANNIMNAKDCHIGSIDSALSVHGRRFRINFFRCMGDKDHQNARLVLRLLNDRIPSVEYIRLPARIRDYIFGLTQGLILVCGKTGSGKSTTIAAILQERAKQRNEHCITLEQPIEYIFEPGRTMFSQREVGLSCSNFADGLKAALRESPDTIFVGEIRDAETAITSLRAAETGHLVFGTLHTNSAAQSVEKFVNQFPSEEQHGAWPSLANCMRLIICQTLVRSAAGGRIAVHEVLKNTTGVAAGIKKREIHSINHAIQTGKNEHGMQSWVMTATELCKEGIISEEVKAHLERFTELA